VFEDGPSVEVHLQWATYYDAADQAGQSRIWGGIHIWPDDGQKLPGSELPYLTHVVSVAAEVMHALAREPLDDPDLAVACALLHDTIEDCGVDESPSPPTFGPAVADGVRALSKDPTWPSPGHGRQPARIQQQPREVWMVKLADRINNLKEPPHYWTPAKIAAYGAEARSSPTPSAPPRPTCSPACTPRSPPTPRGLKTRPACPPSRRPILARREHHLRRSRRLGRRRLRRALRHRLRRPRVRAPAGPRHRRQLVNLASNGGTSETVRDAQLGPALAARPSVVSLFIGGNDVWRGVEPARFARNLAAIADRLDRTRSRVVVGTLPNLAHAPAAGLAERFLGIGRGRSRAASSSSTNACVGSPWTTATPSSTSSPPPASATTPSTSSPTASTPRPPATPHGSTSCGRPSQPLIRRPDHP
jgi:hypothetical protein